MPDEDVQIAGFATETGEIVSPESLESSSTSIATATVEEKPITQTKQSKEEIQRRTPGAKEFKSLDDFKKARQNPENIVAKPNEEAKPAEVKPAEVKPEEKKPAETLPTARDLSDFPEEYHPHLKQMSNEAFAFIKPQLIARLKQAEIDKAKDDELQRLRTGALPNTYYEHPQAYLLSPTYKQMVVDENFYNNVLSHLNSQLEKVENGEEWQDIGVNEKGELVTSQNQPADAKSKVHIMNKISNIYSRLNSTRANMANFESEFTARHRADVSVLQDITTKLYPKIKESEKDIWQGVQTIIDALPGSVRSHPVSRAFAIAAASNQMAIKESELHQRENGALKTKIKELETKIANMGKLNNAHPSEKEMGLATSNNGTDGKQISFKAMRERRSLR